MGDSVLDQVYKGLRFAAKVNNAIGRANAALESHIMCCMPETHEALHDVFIANGMIREKSLEHDREHEVLVFGFSNWYKKDQGVSCHCLPERGVLDNCDQDVAEPFGTREWLDCMRRPNKTRKFGWTKCANLRMKICRHRRLTGYTNQCAYRKDLLRLARYLRANRKQLPKHVILVNVGATHESMIFPDPDWQSAIEEAIFRKYAPHVTFVKQWEILKDRPESHCEVPGTIFKDPWHWCFHSPAFEEYVGNIASAIVARTEVP